MDGNFTVIVVQDFYWLNMMFNEGEKIVFKDGETVFKNGVRSSKYKSAKYFIERNKLKYCLEEYAGDIKYTDIMHLPGGKSEIHCYNEEAFKKDMEDKKTIILNESIKVSEISSVIEWLQNIQLYYEQNKEQEKPMTKEEIEKALGYKIKIVE